jgi:antitoxin PrlF
MAESTVTSRGRVTVPARVRRALNAKPGTRLLWHVTPQGDVLVRAKTLSILDLAGLLNTDKSVDIDDMDPWQS